MAREESLLISEELFNALSGVSGDMDWQYIWPYILIAQDRQIQPVIGQPLYEKLMEDIKNATLTGDYQLLVEDYIAKALTHFGVYEGLTNWAVKIVNSGVVYRLTDDGQPITINEAKTLAGERRQIAEYYLERLIKYLCANRSKYPEMRHTPSGEMSPEPKNYQGGMNLEPYTKRTIDPLEGFRGNN